MCTWIYSKFEILRTSGAQKITWATKTPPLSMALGTKQYSVDYVRLCSLRNRPHGRYGTLLCESVPLSVVSQLRLGAEYYCNNKMQSAKKMKDPTVDGINLATPRAPRGPKFHKFRFFAVLRVPGGPGAITNRRGMKKHARILIFVDFGWIYKGFV